MFSRFLHQTLWTALILFAFNTNSLAAAPDFVQLAKDLKPAVVNISTSKTIKQRRPQIPDFGPQRDFFDDFFNRFFQGQPQRERKTSSLGSGFIIDKECYILTNDHVVNGADEIEVKMSDDHSFPAKIIGSDSKLDLALLKIETDHDLPVAKLGNSENLQVGEWVMAIGNPFGLEQTVTAGIVSAKGRVIGAGPYDDFIQTDASINPGNSGGPLFNANGEVIGINTAIVARGQGIGFAIPVNMAREIIDQLKETGHVTRGWLGVSVQDISEELAESFDLDSKKGALVAEVIADSPAEKAGIKRGDIILSFNGNPVDELRDLPRLVAATPIDKKVNVVLFRDGKKKTVTVTIGKMDGDEQGPAAIEESDLGLNLTDITHEFAERYSLETTEGVLVTGIDPEGPAIDANLRPGDVIVEINGRGIRSVKEFRAVTGEVKEGKYIRLLVQRATNLFYTTIKK
ncbi:MAG: peptidase [Desulfuromonas sp.]|nr:MAG: peptidase [Desulfuromonas sp.]